MDPSPQLVAVAALAPPDAVPFLCTVALALPPSSWAVRQAGTVYVKTQAHPTRGEPRILVAAADASPPSSGRTGGGAEEAVTEPAEDQTALLRRGDASR